jgi:hypothetical protein
LCHLGVRHAASASASQRGGRVMHWAL